MLQNYAQIETAILEMVNCIQANFSQGWLLHPGSKDLPKINASAPHDGQYHMQRFELCCALEGTVFLQVDRDILQLQQGQVFLLPAGTLHQELSLPGYTGTSCWFVCFHDRVWINVCATGRDGSYQLLHGQRIPIDPIGVSLLLKDVCKEMTQTLYGADAMLRCTVLQLLLILLRQLKATEQTLTTQQWRESVVKEVLTHLRDQSGTIPDMNALADRCAMSVNHLNSIFKTVTGKTINAYCADLRIDQAKHLLETSGMKLREISEQLGYYDQYHFCKAFKKATGKSPSAYKAEKSAKEFT